ncbi:hypothetical protein J2W25_001865 [Variovorax boronicumulans]|uniref:Transposase IS4-like domain-containing protein n=1 Tax=Variovorax boronicumulans TaxID=436515 RepID=A0AAW8DU35_9BURK|nr:hypothetical protein [Variovorax boronicumulans]MDP9922844.1 hypothetical protein [Variovorax boronicumulans]
MPDYSTLSRRQKTLSVAIATRRSSAGLHLLIDSTGVKMLGEGEWKTKKHGADYRRQWRKVHLGIDAQTLEIRAIEITDNAIGDAPMLPQLLAQIPADEQLHSVSADGAYDTKACHEAIASRQSPVGRLQSAGCSRQAAVGSRQSAVGSRQSAVGRRQAAAIIPTRKNARPGPFSSILPDSGISTDPATGLALFEVARPQEHGVAVRVHVTRRGKLQDFGVDHLSVGQVCLRKILLALARCEVLFKRGTPDHHGNRPDTFGAFDAHEQRTAPVLEIHETVTRVDAHLPLTFPHFHNFCHLTPRTRWFDTGNGACAAPRLSQPVVRARAGRSRIAWPRANAFSWPWAMTMTPPGSAPSPAQQRAHWPRYAAAGEALRRHVPLPAVKSIRPEWRAMGEQAYSRMRADSSR